MAGYCTTCNRDCSKCRWISFRDMWFNSKSFVEKKFNSFSSDLSESPPFSRDVNSATCVEGITIEFSGNHSCDPRNNQFAFDKSFSGGMPSSSPSCINCSADTSLVTFYPLTTTNLLHAPTCTEMSMSDAIFSNYLDSSIDETDQSEAHSNSEFLNTEGYSNE